MITARPLIVRLTAEGLGPTAIARHLNATGIATPSGRGRVVPRDRDPSPPSRPLGCVHADLPGQDAVTAYGDRDYRAALQVLRSETYSCWHGCGRRATTPDHVPALAEHRHDPGSGCCQLRPSCYPCNASAGAALGNRRRRVGARLAPGSGWAV